MNAPTWPTKDVSDLELQAADLKADIDQSEAESTKIQQAMDRADRRAPDFDRDWFSRARAALAIRRKNEQRMREELSGLKRRIRSARDDSFKQCLIGAVRRAVGDDRFREIWKEAMDEWARAKP